MGLKSYNNIVEMSEILPSCDLTSHAPGDSSPVSHHKTCVQQSDANEKKRLAELFTELALEIEEGIKN